MRSAAANSPAVQNVSNSSRSSGSSSTSMLAGNWNCPPPISSRMMSMMRGMVLHRPVDRGIEIAAVEDDVAVVERLAGFDLAVDHRVEAGLHRGEPRQRLTHRRNVARAGEARDEARDAEHEAQLRAEPHVGLMVRDHMRRGLDVDVARQRRDCRGR